MLLDPQTLHETMATANKAEQPFLLYSLLQPMGAEPQQDKPPEQIAEARHFDIDVFSDADSPFPHTLLSPAAFEAKCKLLGISSQTPLVVYDTVGVYASPRLWFNFTLMGAQSVQLLNGGLPLWKQQGYASALVSLAPQPQLLSTRADDFSARCNLQMLATKESVLMALSDPQYRIVDVRSAARFWGRVPEPRLGLRSGHIPTSVNIPFGEFLDGHCFKTPEALRAIFESVGCEPHHSLIFSCGSGVTACIGYVAALLCGYSDLRVYDGSWAEWGSLDSLPIEKHVDHNT